MLHFSFQREQNVGILTFKGEIPSLYNDDFRSALLISLSNADKVVVNFDAVSAFDRICIQTFWKVVRMAKRLKKDLIFNLVSLKARLDLKPSPPQSLEKSYHPFP